MAIAATADLVGSDTEVAVKVTAAGLGTLAGAVYVMGAPDALEAVDNVPQVAPLHPVPARLHVTPLFCESFCTVALKLCPLFTCTVALDGATPTTMPCGADVMVMVAAADLPVLATEVAVRVTVAGLGTFAGAV